MKIRSIAQLSVILLLCISAFGQTQTTPQHSIVVQVGTRQIRLADLGKYPRLEVKAKDHDGKVSTYSGVELREILGPLGAKMGKDLRGKELTNHVLIEAADGYRVVFALAELDPEFTDDPIILADTQDGKPLTEKNGPFQIIAPADKRHGRWIRQVTAIKLISAQ